MHIIRGKNLYGYDTKVAAIAGSKIVAKKLFEVLA